MEMFNNKGTLRKVWQSIECHLANNNDRWGCCDNEKKLWYILIEKNWIKISFYNDYSYVKKQIHRNKGNVPKC